MNGIEKIIARIDSDTQTEIDRILNEAGAQAERISGKYRSMAAAEAAGLDLKNEKAAAAREERLISAARMEGRRTALAARQEKLKDAYDLALKKLCALPDDEYIEVAADLLTRAAPAGKGSVVFAPEERERIGRAAVERANALLGGGELTLSLDTQDMRGGFILKAGRVEVNCAFETLIRLSRAETAGAAAKLLFPEGEGQEAVTCLR